MITSATLRQHPSLVVPPFPDLLSSLHEVSKAAFLEMLLKASGDKSERNKRVSLRRELIKKVPLQQPTSKQIKLVAFDVDQTMGLLYPISSPTAVWALSHLAHHHKIELQSLFSVTRTLPPELLCHSEASFLFELSKMDGFERLHPDNLANKTVLDEWHDMRVELNNRWRFKDIVEGVRYVKDKGGLVYIVTNGPRASVLHRLYMWLGLEGADLIDGVAAREDLPGIPAENPRATDEEKHFIHLLEAQGKIAVISEKLIKPNGYHLNWALQHANKNLGSAGSDPIKPSEVLMFGDSLSSDGGAAHNLANYANGEPAQFALSLKGLVVDPFFLSCHAQVGHDCDRLGVLSFLEKLRQTPKNHFPSVALVRFPEISNVFDIMPAKKPKSALQVDSRLWQPQNALV